MLLVSIPTFDPLIQWSTYHYFTVSTYDIRYMEQYEISILTCSLDFDLFRADLSPLWPGITLTAVSAEKLLHIVPGDLQRDLLGHQAILDRIFFSVQAGLGHGLAIAGEISLERISHHAIQLGRLVPDDEGVFRLEDELWKRSVIFDKGFLAHYI